MDDKDNVPYHVTHLIPDESKIAGGEIVLSKPFLRLYGLKFFDVNGKVLL